MQLVKNKKNHIHQPVPLIHPQCARFPTQNAHIEICAFTTSRLATSRLTTSQFSPRAELRRGTEPGKARPRRARCGMRSSPPKAGTAPAQSGWTGGGLV